MKFKLQFRKNKIKELAAQYSYEKEHYIIDTLSPRIKSNGYLTKRDFLVVLEWKTPRTKSRCQQNDPGFIKEITRIALSSNNERLKIEILTLLHGVDWPSASVILHFGDKKKYPILDFRALWSLGFEEPPKYNFEFWWEYTLFCRNLAKEFKMSMRDLDRALWQYSKENQ